MGSPQFSQEAAIDTQAMLVGLKGIPGQIIYTEDTSKRFMCAADGSTWVELADKAYIDAQVATKQNVLGYTPENVANKSTSTSLGTSDTLYPSQKAAKTYIDTQDATKQNVLGYTPEDVANKDTDGSLTANSDTKYASQKAVKTYVDSRSVLASPTAVTRSFNTNFQPSTTKSTLGCYTVELSASLTLITGQSGTVFFEVSANGTSGWAEVGRFTNGNTGTLTIGLNLTQTVGGTLVGMIPPGYFARLRTTGTATITYRSGQETVV